jgi:hypothetical protein
MLADNDDSFSITAAEELLTDSIDPGGVSTPQPEVQEAQLSLFALSGAPAADTIRILGYIGSHPVRVLVDGGSTHNFIQDSIAEVLGLAHDSIKPFKVLVGSGQELLCSQICPAVSIMLQQHTFTTDLYRLGLRGADIILGAQWLKQIGPILMNYATLSLSFFYKNQCIELKGESPAPTVGFHYFQKAARFDSSAQFFSLSIIEPPPDPNLHPSSSTNPFTNEM